MNLKDIFNDKDYIAYKKNSAVLQVSNGVFTTYYDFKQRVVANGHGTMIPFSQVDPDVLVAMRDKLVDLGGKPPELPLAAPPDPKAQGNKFNL